MSVITEFNSEGRFIRVLSSNDPSLLELNRAADCSYLDGHWSGEHYYVADGQVTERPTQTTTLSGFTLTGLPTPCMLWIDSTSYPVTDSTVTLDLPLPGVYTLRVEAWPYIDWTGSATV